MFLAAEYIKLFDVEFLLFSVNRANCAGSKKFDDFKTEHRGID